LQLALALWPTITATGPTIIATGSQSSALGPHPLQLAIDEIDQMVEVAAELVQLPDVERMALVQTFGINATKRSGTLCGLCGENCIPDFWRGFAIDAKLSERELTFPDPMHEFNAGDGDRGAPKALQSKHWTQTKFDRSMVLLYQII
jgi:hypothetical protein